MLERDEREGGLGTEFISLFVEESKKQVRSQMGLKGQNCQGLDQRQESGPRILSYLKSLLLKPLRVRLANAAGRW